MFVAFIDALCQVCLFVYADLSPRSMVYIPYKINSYCSRRRRFQPTESGRGQKFQPIFGVSFVVSDTHSMFHACDELVRDGIA
jgi:hypothetical protein